MYFSATINFQIRGWKKHLKVTIWSTKTSKTIYFEPQSESKKKYIFPDPKTV